MPTSTQQTRSESVHSPNSTQRMSEDQFRQLVWLWVQERTIREISKVLEFSPRTIGERLRRIRARIEMTPEAKAPKLKGRVQIDMFRGMRRRSTSDPMRPLLLGMMNQDGDARIFVIQQKTKAEIYPLVKAHVEQGATLITNKSNVYTSLRKDGYPILFQDSPFETMVQLWSERYDQILAAFWGRLMRRNNAARGVRESTFHMRLREAELRWRFRAKGKAALYEHVLNLMRSPLPPMML